jgi:hypothetical protein
MRVKFEVTCDLKVYLGSDEDGKDIPPYEPEDQHEAWSHMSELRDILEEELARPGFWGEQGSTVLLSDVTVTKLNP